LILFGWNETWGMTPIAKGVGARALAMGQAFAGLADDSSAIFTNPAGLTSLSRLNLSNMYSTPFENKRLITLAAAFPNFWGGTAGIGYNNLTTFQTLVLTEYLDFSQQEIFFSYAREIRKDLSLGGSFKIFSRGLSKDIYPAAKGDGMDADLALKYSPRNWLALGANLQNTLPESLGGKFTRGNGESEGIPLNIKVGVSAKVREDLSLNLDADKSRDLPTLLHLGVEWWPVKFFALRGGIDQIATLINSQTFNNLTLGFGLKYAGITFDYAYYQLGESTRRVEHYFSIGYVGEEKVKPAPPPLPTREVTVIKRKHFSDVPENYWARDPIEILASIGIISGYPDGTFRPEGNITRAEMCKLLMMTRLATEEGRGMVFKDVPEKHWAAQFIAQAAEAEIVKGYPDGTFKPAGNITRAEGVATIARFARLEEPKVIESPYTDVPGRYWAVREIQSAKAAGLLKFIGYQFEPQKNLTRSEVAEILYQTQFVKKKLLDIIVM